MDRASERELIREAPRLLAELLDAEVTPSPLADHPAWGQPDLVVEARGRHWVIEVKSSGGPGIVRGAVEQLHGLVRDAPGGVDVVGLVVVPAMGPAGGGLARGENLGWVDLAGNAEIRAGDIYVHVQGRPRRHVRRGRPANAFAPKSSRIAHLLLTSPEPRRQVEIAQVTKLDDGQVSRVLRRLVDDRLVERVDDSYRVSDRDLLLDAWAERYQFDRHDIVAGHVTGSGEELARSMTTTLAAAGVHHAFTGLPAAWAYDPHATFRLSSLYVEGDPRDAADALEMRTGGRGPNVQLIGAQDEEQVWEFQRLIGGLPCASPVQTYLDLLHLPERAREAADHLRGSETLWHGG